MKIVIPMSGTGARYQRAGYTEPKPLIPVDGRPMIEHVIDLFRPTEPDENLIFICNREHLRETPLESILRRVCPGGRILPIDPHKLGPVHAVNQALETFSDDEEVIVNYCDFGAAWDYPKFLQEVRSRRADGAMSAYRGFHPHSLGSTNYAYMRNDGPWMLEIREKQPFTENKMQEYASSGTYYFARGALVKKYFPALVRENIHTNGEYYVSMVYNLLQRDGLKTWIHELEFFLQWGTPEDLQEYQGWSDYFRSVSTPSASSGNWKLKTGNCYTLIPMAGRGARFTEVGYPDPKPFIPIFGKRMIERATASLPAASRWGFVCLSEHARTYPVEKTLRSLVPDCDISWLDRVTQGQAETCLIGARHAFAEQPLLIAPCDNGMIWNAGRYERLITDPSVDAVIWTFRHSAASRRNPNMYGWVRTEGDRATGVSCKIPISDTPFNDHAIIGTFWFRRAEIFTTAARTLMERNIRVNNEFYVDSCMNLVIEAGFKVRVFEVDRYVCWGTPDDVRTYEYWYRYFSSIRPRAAAPLQPA